MFLRKVFSQFFIAKCFKVASFWTIIVFQNKIEVTIEYKARIEQKVDNQVPSKTALPNVSNAIPHHIWNSTEFSHVKSQLTSHLKTKPKGEAYSLDFGVFIFVTYSLVFLLH